MINIYYLVNHSVHSYLFRCEIKIVTRQFPVLDGSIKDLRPDFR